MSEIPFVNQLGDALEEAASAQVARRRRRPRLPRRRLAVALAALLVAGGGAAIAGILNDSEDLAAASVACYEGGYPGGDVTVPASDARSPRALCAEALGVSPRALIACSAGAGVAVIPRTSARNCRSAGLTRLPRGYRTARKKVAALRRSILAIQESVDCIAPATLARRVQALLDRSGWDGWRAKTGPGEGPCGSVVRMGGTARLTLALDSTERSVTVWAGMPRSLRLLLYGSEQGRGLSPRLMDYSGRRCFNEAQLRARARRALAPSGRRVEFTTSELAKDTGMMNPYGRLYGRGCAIIAGLSPAADFEGVRVELLQRAE